MKKQFWDHDPGTVSGVLFALGMCMATLPGGTRSGQASSSAVGTRLGPCHGGRLAEDGGESARPHLRKGRSDRGGGHRGRPGPGRGMCFSMVWGRMVPGIALGLAGIVVLLSLIPLTKGIQ